MVEITGDRMVLTEASEQDIDELYNWVLEEEEQEPKKWKNGPYSSEEKKTKEESRGRD
ncbi:hypothetical protein [Halobacillus sp. Marseille-Q1614]|uniref:hypothetical protein n=1 Tax=Halobacillus sp. Marseille-Q1614 TaxID=2709134 RepID=UPI0035304D72